MSQVAPIKYADCLSQPRLVRCRQYLNTFIIYTETNTCILGYLENWLTNSYLTAPIISLNKMLSIKMLLILTTALEGIQL